MQLPYIIACTSQTMGNTIQESKKNAHTEAMLCLLLNGTSALFRLLVLRIVQIKDLRHVKSGAMEYIWTS